MANVGVIPAAGYATRLQPLSRLQRDAPGTGPARHGLRHRTDAACRLHRASHRHATGEGRRDRARGGLGASIVLGYPSTTSESFAQGIAGLAPEEVVLLGWPDTIWEPEDGYCPLVRAVEGGQEIALGLFQTPDLSDRTWSASMMPGASPVSTSSLPSRRPAGSGGVLPRGRALWRVSSARNGPVRSSTRCARRVPSSFLFDFPMLGWTSAQARRSSERQLSSK